ncbi:hypothetical protein BGZ98_003148 [Dissophora globulifera]|nr:hypothetical protein BGZ98_003148 [Dissophora globulifera]
MSSSIVSSRLTNILSMSTKNDTAPPSSLPLTTSASCTSMTVSTPSLSSALDSILIAEPLMELDDHTDDNNTFMTDVTTSATTKAQLAFQDTDSQIETSLLQRGLEKTTTSFSTCSPSTPSLLAPSTRSPSNFTSSSCSTSANSLSHSNSAHASDTSVTEPLAKTDIELSTLSLLTPTEISAITATHNDEQNNDDFDCKIDATKSNSSSPEPLTSSTSSPTISAATTTINNSTLASSTLATTLQRQQQQQQQDPATMYITGNTTMNSSSSVRSPSLSSVSGSGTGIGGAASTSVSSATTTMSGTLVGNGSSANVAGNGGVGPVVIGGGSAGAMDLKLKRFLEHNQRLKEQLDMHRITVSEASQSLIKFVTTTKDSLLPNLWGNAPSDPFSKQSTGCCSIS